MQIIRSTTDTAPGPSDWFTGTVYIDTIASPPGPRGSLQPVSGSRPAHAPRGTPIRGGRRSTSRRVSGSASVVARRSR